MAPVLHFTRLPAASAAHTAWCRQHTAIASAQKRQQAAQGCDASASLTRHLRFRMSTSRPLGRRMQPCSSASGDAGSLTADATASELIQKEVMLFLIQQVSCEANCMVFAVTNIDHQ